MQPTRVTLYGHDHSARARPRVDGRRADARRWLAAIWQGAPTLTRALRLEWRLILVRWLGIALVAPSLLLTGLPSDRLLAAYVVLLVAGIYNMVIQLLLQRWPGLLANGYLTTVGDALLNIAMVSVGGGFSTPFYYFLFTVSISAAMRYGYGPSLAMVVLYVSLDALESVLARHPLGGNFVFRSSFLFITTVLAGYLREQAQRAESRLQQRLRQARLLNEATVALGASLERPVALQAVATAACHLFGSHYAVLVPAPARLAEVAETPIPPIYYPPDETARSAIHEELAALCQRYAAPDEWQASAPHHFRQVVLPGGQEAMVLAFRLPTRQTTLAMLALTLPPGRPISAADPYTLDSFVERTALAIENVALYSRLARHANDLQYAYSELAIAHQELLSLDEVKTNFLANVSHELRTPLSSIRAFSELLIDYSDDLAVQLEFLQNINLESERLTRLVNDVLDIAKIEAGQMDWHKAEFDLAALVAEAAQTYAPLAGDRGLDFRRAIGADLPPVYADRPRIKQVIDNLLSNALKFTPRGSIALGVRQVDAELQVSVTDTGIGIRPGDRERIFEKFHQVGDTLTDKPRGTGLGLCISRDIITHHGGRLWVQSEHGQGSTFTFALPIAAAAAGGTTAAAQPAWRSPTLDLPPVRLSGRGARLLEPGDGPLAHSA